MGEHSKCGIGLGPILMEVDIEQIGDQLVGR